MKKYVRKIDGVEEVFNGKYFIQDGMVHTNPTEEDLTAAGFVEMTEEEVPDDL
jgi:hypothetical protein